MTGFKSDDKGSAPAASPLLRAWAVLVILFLFLLRAWAIGALAAALIYGLVLAYEHIPGVVLESAGALFRDRAFYAALILAWPLLMLVQRPLKSLLYETRRRSRLHDQAKKIQRHKERLERHRQDLASRAFADFRKD